MRSFLFYVDDVSENSIKTQNLINAQLNKVIEFAKIKNSSKKKINDVKSYLSENLSDLNLKNPIELIKNLPFIRLVKTNIFK